MQKFLDSFSWGILLFLFLPTVGIIASWNSLPGDPLYGVKLSGEQALLFLAKPSYAAEGSLQIRYTERRLAETKSLLANKHSVQGLTYLEKQVASTKVSIQNAPNQVVQKKLAQTYITTLKQVKTELAAQKVNVGDIAVTNASTPIRAPLVHTPTPTPTRFLPALTAGTVPVATPTPSPTPTPTPVQEHPESPPLDIGGEIDQTQENIDETIEDLEKISAQAESVHERNDQRREDRGNERGNDRMENNGNQGRGNNR